MNNPLFDARERAHHAWYRDGLFELGLGMTTLLQGVWLLVVNPVDGTPAWHVSVTLVYIVLLIGASRLTTVLRVRLTYPRTGYVANEPSVLQRRIVVGTVLAILAIAIGMLAFHHSGYATSMHFANGTQWLPAVVGLVMGPLAVYIGVRRRLLRFWGVGAFAMVLGVAVCLDYPPRLGSAIFLVGVGGSLMFSGGVALWNYLRLSRHTAHET